MVAGSGRGCVPARRAAARHPARRLLRPALHVVGAVVAYLAANAVPVGADYGAVFCFVAVAAFAAYGLAEIPYSIWFSRRWGTTLRNLFDALLYALVTAGTFGWLWP